MKKLISLLLILILSIGALTSCGDRKYDEAEVKAAAKSLIEGSVILNEIYWGDGIQYTDDKNSSDGSFYMALDSYCYLNGFTTIKELKVLTEKIFSKEFCKSQIYSPVLADVSDGADTAFLARYYQKYNADDLTEPECIMVNTSWKSLLSGKVEYDYGSLTVIGSEGETVYVTLNATVTLDSLEPQTREIRVALVEEENGWRLDSPTYLNYVKSN